MAHSSLPLTPHLEFEKQRPSYRGTGSGASFAFRAPGRQRNSGPSPRAGVRGIIGTSPLPLIACLAHRGFCLPGASHGPGVGSLSSCLGWGSCGGGGLPIPQPWSARGLRGPLAVLCLGSPPPPRELPPGSGRVKGLPAPEDLGFPALSAQHSMNPLIYTQGKCEKVLCPSAQTGLLGQAGQGPAPLQMTLPPLPPTPLPPPGLQRPHFTLGAKPTRSPQAPLARSVEDPAHALETLKGS